MDTEYILDAIEASKEDGKRSVFDDQDGEFDILIDLIANNSPLNTDEFKISENRYKRELKDIIKEIVDSENPIPLFFRHLNNLKQELRQNIKEYEIVFPLNIRLWNVEDFEPPISILDIELHTLHRQEWYRRERIAIENSKFKEFIDGVPTLLGPSGPYSNSSFWKVKYEAADMGYAVNHVESVIKLLLGKLSFAAHYGSTSFPIRTVQWEYGMSTLELPLCYLVFESGEFEQYYRSTTLKPRFRDDISGLRQEHFESIYPTLPNFTESLTEADDHLISALRSYFTAISESDNQQALLAYWRCLESATLSQDEGYSSKDPLLHARLIVRPNKTRISEDRIDKLANKRNNLIHKSEEPTINKGDLIHLKILSESAIYFLINKKEEYTVEQLRFMFENGSKTEEEIKQGIQARESSINNHKEKMRLLEDILEISENV